MCALRSSCGPARDLIRAATRRIHHQHVFHDMSPSMVGENSMFGSFDSPHPGRSWCSRSRIRELYMPSSGSGRSRGRAASGTIVAAKTVGHSYAGLEIGPYRVDSRVHRPDVWIGSVGSSQRLSTPRRHLDGHCCAAGGILRVLRGRSSASRALTAENVPQPAVIAAHEISLVRSRSGPREGKPQPRPMPRRIDAGIPTFSSASIQKDHGLHPPIPVDNTNPRRTIWPSSPEMS